MRVMCVWICVWICVCWAESVSVTCACHVLRHVCVCGCLGVKGGLLLLLRSVFIDFLLSFCLPVILSFSHEMSSEKKSSKTPRPLPSSDEESEDLQFSLASEEVSTYIKKKFL